MSITTKILTSISLTIALITVNFSHAMSNSNSPLDVEIQGNQVYAEISLPGDITADITLTFENTVGLTKDSIGISAELADITSVDFIDRLPSALNTLPQAAFPMMITIEPKVDSGFAFSGLASVDIHTHNLEYTAATPLRFFKSPLNGEFKDITVTMGAGSYRARGSTGTFSQFIIVADLRPANVVVTQKFQDLSLGLTEFSPLIAPEVYQQLVQVVNDAEQYIALQQYKAAEKRIAAFNLLIKNNRGQAIPDVWRSSRDIRNVAGELMAFANTLKFSLRLIQ